MASVVGLSEKRLAKVRGRLEAFAVEMFEGAMGRSEQRKWGGVYLRGLMLDGRRKSIEPMAARLPDGDEQCLQQFVNQSPWSWEAVRANLARRMSAVSVSAATDAASCPLDWRIFLPAEWDDDAERRTKAHVPDQLRHQPKWRLALEMIDELRDWGLVPPVVCADAGYGEITAFARGSMSARSPTSSRSRRPRRPTHQMFGLSCGHGSAVGARRCRVTTPSRRRCASWRWQPAPRPPR
jgi:SRSO17 transposase